MLYLTLPDAHDHNAASLRFIFKYINATSYARDSLWYYYDEQAQSMGGRGLLASLVRLIERGHSFGDFSRAAELYMMLQETFPDIWSRVSHVFQKKSSFILVSSTAHDRDKIDMCVRFLQVMIHGYPNFFDVFVKAYLKKYDVEQICESPSVIVTLSSETK
jgi:hypothetical protein